MIAPTSPVVLTLRPSHPPLVNNGMGPLPKPVVLALTAFYAGARGMPGDLSEDELRAAIDLGVTTQRFDFAALVDSAISI